MVLLPAPATADAHHCKRPSCAKLKRGYHACARHPGTFARARCEIRRAARHYHQPVAAAYRVAHCESTYRWWIDGHHEGMWQFLWSTWATTPFHRHTPYSPKWSSLAAMWMWSVGRRGEWACR